MVADTVDELCRMYDDGRKVTLELHVVEWSDTCECPASLTSNFETKNLELQIMPGSVTEVPRLLQRLSVG